MSKIIGVTVGSSLPKPNFKQTDPTKGDYIKNKPDFDGMRSKVEQIEVRVDTLQENAYDDTELRGVVSEHVAKIDALNELVGNTKVETQIGDAVSTLESEIDDHLAAMQTDIDSKVDAVDGMGLSSNDYTTAEKDKLSTVEANANFYEHPVHDSRSLGLYKVTVDGEGHISTVALVEKEDIVALGIPAQDTTYDEEISDLSDRIDDVENSINTTNETLEGVAQDFENYKTTNNDAVSTNTADIDTLKDLVGNIKVTTQIENAIADKADEVHLHVIADVTGLQTALDGKEASGAVSTHNTSTSAHNDIRGLIDDLTTRLNALADSDDTTLDQMSEIVDYIKGNKSLIDSITTSKVNVADIVNNLTTNVSTKPLSAAQGVAIKALIDTLQENVNGKANTSDLTSHTGNKSNPHSVTLSQLGVTATTAELNKLDGVTATTAELNYVDGVTSNIQDQLNAKQALVTGAATTITDSNLTASRALISNGSGKVAASAVTSTELGYLDGVTSSVQSQLDAKVPTSRTVNGKALSSNITLSASDVGADVGGSADTALVNAKSYTNSKITELAGEVDTINTRVGEIETDITAYKTEVSDNFTEIDTTINSHIVSVDNPHGVTKEQIGLTNVDNTSDLEKPISNATQVALNKKANAEHEHSDLYYTKDELLEMFELITVEDIDNICASPSEGLAYTLNSSGTEYVVSGIGTCEDTNVYIPSIYNGLPVTSIGDNAFQGCTNLNSIVMPDSITNVGTNAFLDCINLTSIVLSNSITTLSYSMFNECNNLAYVNIPNSVTTINSYAFAGCTSLTSITIPSSVTKIYAYAFRVCPNIETFNVDPGNQVYHSDGNCIIHTAEKSLVAGCGSSKIPDDGSVINLGYGAFIDCTSLTSITIPSSVTSIGNNAFRCCTNLTSITIPSSVISIGDSAFYDCGKLMHVYYDSSADKWKAISISTNNTALTNATIHYGIIDTITFTISGTSYQAEEGMTWAEWVDSEYSPTWLYNNGTYIHSEGGAQVVGVSPTDTIIPDSAYIIRAPDQ